MKKPSRKYSKLKISPPQKSNTMKQKVNPKWGRIQRDDQNHSRHKDLRSLRVKRRDSQTGSKHWQTDSRSTKSIYEEIMRHWDTGGTRKRSRLLKRLLVTRRQPSKSQILHITSDYLEIICGNKLALMECAVCGWCLCHVYCACANSKYNACNLSVFGSARKRH